MSNVINCYVSISTDNLKNLLSNFDIPYNNGNWNIKIKPLEIKVIGNKTRKIIFKKGDIEYNRNIKYNKIKYIDKCTINIEFFERNNDSNNIVISKESEKNDDYFFSDSINIEDNTENRKFIILRQDLRNNLFSKLFPGSILEKNQNQIKNGKNKNYGYLTFIDNKKDFNIIPPFAFTSKRKNKEILIESILLGISIKKEQEEVNKVYPNSPQQKRLQSKKQEQFVPENIKCMIVTHNSILRCFLRKITDNTEFQKTRFKNNVILRITINENSSYIEMMSEGNLPKESKKSYFTEPTFKKMKNEFLSNYWNILGCNLEIYIVRHGVAYHNIRNVFTKHLVYDTSLVINQNKLSKETKKNIPADINYYFVSPLIRTRETLINFIPDIKDKKIAILPCSREIGSAKGDCRQEKIKPFENRTWSGNKNKPKIDNITWDWSFYDREKGKCPEDSNMIYEMIKYIFYEKIYSDNNISKDNKKSNTNTLTKSL